MATIEGRLCRHQVRKSSIPGLGSFVSLTVIPAVSRTVTRPAILRFVLVSHSVKADSLKDCRPVVLAKN